MAWTEERRGNKEIGRCTACGSPLLYKDYNEVLYAYHCQECRYINAVGHFQTTTTVERSIADIEADIDKRLTNTV